MTTLPFPLDPDDILGLKSVSQGGLQLPPSLQAFLVYPETLSTFELLLLTVTAVYYL